MLDCLFRPEFSLQRATQTSQSVYFTFCGLLPVLCPVSGVTTAAVCVYPSRVADAVKSLKAANSSLPVASGESPETESHPVTLHCRSEMNGELKCV